MGRTSGGPGLGLLFAGTAQVEGAWWDPASQLAPSGGGRAPGLLGRNVRARALGPGVRAQGSSWSPLGVVAVAAFKGRSVERRHEQGGAGAWAVAVAQTGPVARLRCSVTKTVPGPLDTGLLACCLLHKVWAWQERPSHDHPGQRAQGRGPALCSALEHSTPGHGISCASACWSGQRLLRRVLWVHWSVMSTQCLEVGVAGGRAPEPGMVTLPTCTGP